MRHKHADLIHAWAEGQEFEYNDDGRWKPVSERMWLNYDEYRIKPAPKLDVVAEGWICRVDSMVISQDGGTRKNIRCTFDGETGKLKSVEVLK